MKKIISIVTPTYNEEQNIEKLILDIETIMNSLKSQYDYEHIVIDNKSKDKTINILKKNAKKNKKLKVIINSRNYGQVRSGFFGILQAKGEAVIFMNSDFQDPVELIPDYIESWEKGHRITMGQKIATNDFFLMKLIKRFFHKLLFVISEVKMPLYTTGSGIYDRKVIEVFREINDPYPYIRGLSAEVEDEINLIPFKQPRRLGGESKNSFLTMPNRNSMYDIALLAIIKQSSLPLRFVIFLGFISSIFSFLIAFTYFLYKLIYWQSFEMGIGPIIIGMFGFFSITIFLMGLIGEYILLILSYSQQLPLVIEKERINF